MDRIHPLFRTKNLFFFLMLAGIGLVKLSLVADLPFSVACSGYDDLLFVRLAESIAAGDWLGTFDHKTLIKGPVYPLWIALAHKAGIALFTAQRLLYLLACLVFVLCFSHVTSRRFLLIMAFLLLVFNPMTFSPTTWRNGIYPALTLFVVSFAMGVVFSEGHWIRQVAYALLLGVFLSAFWMTREEGAWIFLFLAFVFVCFLVGSGTTEKISLKKVFQKGLVCGLPFFILWASIFVVSWVNRQYYDAFCVIELKTRPFKTAYASFLRVKPNKFRYTVSMTDDVLEKLYGASPAFGELRPMLDGDIGKAWQMGTLFFSVKKQYENGGLDSEVREYIQSFLQNDPSGIWRDIWDNISPDDTGFNGAGFIWAFREAVTSAGYYASAQKSREFYARIAREVSFACENSGLDCTSRPMGLMPPWKNLYFVPIVKTFLHGYYFLSSFLDCRITSDPGISRGDKAVLALYEKMIGMHIPTAPAEGDETQNRADLSVLRGIWVIYHLAFPWLAAGALLCHLFFAIRGKKQKGMATAFALLISGSGLILILSLVNVTSFPAMVSRYFSPLYPMLIVYVIFIAAWLVPPKPAD